MFRVSIKTILLLICTLQMAVNKTQCCNLNNAANTLSDAMDKASDKFENTVSAGVNDVKVVVKDVEKAVAEASATLSGSMGKSAEEISFGMRNASLILAAVADKGVDAAREAVRGMSEAVAALAESVSIRMHSGDLKDIGQGAAEQLKEGIVGLSKNWELSLKSADLEQLGATAARHLSTALQNINIRLDMNFNLGKEALSGVGYLSIAIGGAFGVLLFSIVVCLGTRLPCCGNLMDRFSSPGNNNLSKSFDDQTPNQRNIAIVYSGQIPPNGFQGSHSIFSNKQIYEPFVHKNHSDRIYENNNYS